MLEAITYQDMLREISNNAITEDTIGILITRPELDTEEIPWVKEISGGRHR